MPALMPLTEKSRSFRIDRSAKQERIAIAEQTCQDQFGIMAYGDQALRTLGFLAHRTDRSHEAIALLQQSMRVAWHDWCTEKTRGERRV